MILSTISGTAGSLVGQILGELNGALKGGDKAAEKAEKKAEKAEEKAEKKASKGGNGALAAEDSAVRFDLSVPPQTAVPPVPATAPVANVAAAPSAVLPVAQAAPTPAISIPTLTEANAPGGRGAGIAVVPAAAAPASGIAAPLYEAANLDEEGMARAQALRAIARENVLGLIDRITRLADRPEQAETRTAASGNTAPASNEAAEQRTLARL